MISIHHPRFDFFFFPLSHIFSLAPISHSLSTDTTELHSLTSCLYVWCFIRTSPTAPSQHYRRSVMFVWKTLPLHTLSPSTRLPPTWCFLWRLSAMAWDVSCLLTRRPNLHCDFIIAIIHYQFVFSFGASLLKQSHLCIHFIYWYSVCGAYYS